LEYFKSVTTLGTGGEKIRIFKVEAFLEEIFKYFERERKTSFFQVLF